MDQREDYFNKLKAEDEALSAELRAKYYANKIRAKNEWEELETKQRTWKSSVEKAKMASEEKWEDVKTGLERGWRDIQESFGNLKRRLSQ